MDDLLYFFFHGLVSVLIFVGRVIYFLLFYLPELIAELWYFLFSERRNLAKDHIKECLRKSPSELIKNLKLRRSTQRVLSQLIPQDEPAIVHWKRIPAIERRRIIRAIKKCDTI